MFVGEAPGEKEDREGRPFCGRAGAFLDELLGSAGIVREEAYITSCVKCRPPGNRKPRLDELETCGEAWLERQIGIVDPPLLVPLGTVALRQVLGESGALRDFHGETFLRDDRRVVPTYHPAAGMRFPAVETAMRKDFEAVRRQLALLTEER